MEGDNGLDGVVRKQLDEILKKKQVGANEVREDISQEALDKFLEELKEVGASEKEAQEIVNTWYESIPTMEMKEIMDKAKELAKTYLPSLADQIIDSEPYLITRKGIGVLLTVDIPLIKGDLIEVPIDLVGMAKHTPVYLRNGQMENIVEEGQIRAYGTFSGKNILVEQLLGDYKISGPTKEEFRKSALEAALDYFASPKPRFLLDK